uniref:UBC core domain-containing protein n=1 Tax=Phaeomonas parva TaxID=124430 RepID=A0A7S1UEY4_9STRA|mmetsp:Transcript_45043/g.141075  ORF Transcript_45043/g.141075 Transcript_45043/m.141075 type:complete len:150 (+) Transcript_45043:128-577(+)|eukprot:CAMPEP_0118885512 /NCGR_PEP_ID=MMETSP1163-20130328/23951_1 /TAXON_ID=124430 /ORGANISM="Phaeomonas parva, Strain CCMP2877" /LENGTH=149 /DNA_ID=CAMNT_0006823539 /DNA_START=38 /DNA_END=487 /DNA_ORIENTATION=-
MASPGSRRLRKELQRCVEAPLEGVVIAPNEADPSEWNVNMEGAPGSIYAGEAFRLRFRFPDDYPLSAPEVVFEGESPVHPHVYSNGHICLSILYEEWSPALTVQSVVLSILSMLSSATEKTRPPDDAIYSRTSGISPKDTLWHFDDDTV